MVMAETPNLYCFESLKEPMRNLVKVALAGVLILVMIGGSARAVYASHSFGTDYDSESSTVTGLYTEITAPSVANAYNQNTGSYFLLNVYVCNSGCSSYDFIQVGFEFTSYGGSGIGKVVWTDQSTYSSYPQSTGVPYVAGDVYDMSIDYDTATSCWSVWIIDSTSGNSGNAPFSAGCNAGLTYVYEPTPNSGVFFENMNANTNWYTNLGTLQATYSQSLFSNGWSYWNTDVQVTYDCHGNIANIATSGALSHYHTTTWSASGMPLAC